MAQTADTLTTRDAVRRAVADDIVGRAQAVAVKGEGPLDGVDIISLGTLRQVVNDHLSVQLPPPSDKHAEVTTPATVNVHTICPECDLPSVITGKLTPQLTVTNDGAEIAAKFKAKSKVHVCGQLSLPESDVDQATLDEALDDEDVAPAEPVAVFNLLLLISEARDYSVIAGWDQVTLELVADYAAAVHLRASDHDDVEIPDLPAVLAETVRKVHDDVDLEWPPVDAEGEADATPAAGDVESIADAAVAATEAEMANVMQLRCVGANHVPGCEHFPDVPKRGRRTPGDA